MKYLVEKAGNRTLNCPARFARGQCRNAP
jgi:hypothetical protein